MFDNLKSITNDVFYNQNSNLDLIYTLDFFNIRNLDFDYKIILDDIKNNNKLLIVYYYEYISNIEILDKFIQYCQEINLPLYIFTRNIVFYKFFEKKYGRLENIWISNPKYAFISDMQVDVFNKKLNNEFEFKCEKDINLLFLNFNRKPNADYIIYELYKRNELYNKSNYISYYNFLEKNKLGDTTYEKIYKSYFDETQIDLNFLNNLKIIPNLETNVLNEQNKTQIESFELHARSKFNIICEAKFGLGNNETEFDFYNFFISRKTFLPFLYENVFFIHEYNNLYSDELKKLGFKMFFNSFDEFFKNMNDDYYNLISTQEILAHNKKLVIELLCDSRIGFKNEIDFILNGL